MTVDKIVVVQKNQKQKVKRKSGGIVALIKTNLYKHIEYSDRDCEYVLWCKLDKALFETDEDFYFGTVYAPTYTGYCQTDILEQFYYESEYMLLTRANKYVYPLGDFCPFWYMYNSYRWWNALTDGVNSELVFMFDSIDMLNRLDIDWNRVSKDSKVNSSGKQLLDFFKKK